MNTIKALIFDMGGLLTDTETLHLKSYMAALEKCGLPITAEFYAPNTELERALAPISF